MNPYVLWVPGVALILTSAVLLGLDRIGMVSALIAMGIGVTIETIGVLLWRRERRRRTTD